MTNYDRVSVIVGVILVGVVLLLVLEIPERVFLFEPLGTPLTFRITGTWLVSLLLIGLACAGTEAVMHSHPSVRRRAVRHTFPNWILPSLTTLALTVLLPRSPNLLYWLVGLTLGGGVLAWLILADYRALGGGPARTASARTGQRLVSYVLALVFFTAIYQTRSRSLVTASAVTLIAALLSLSILREGNESLRRSGLFAAVIGLVLGQTTWALNYWQADPLTVGILMMLLFYVTTGLVREHIRRGISGSILLEFALVAAVCLGAVLRFGPR